MSVTSQPEERPAAAAPAAAPRAPPAWISMPGAPVRADFGAFGRNISELSAQKQKYIDEIKALQSSLGGGDDGRSELNAERATLRDRLADIDTQRRAQVELRTSKNNEIGKIRQQRREASDKLREVQNDLGGMESVQEIDAAIRYLMKKMETRGGGLSSERRTAQQLHQLEEAKALLHELQPLGESIRDSEEREQLLQLEYREIHERVGQLNKEFEDQLTVKRAKDKEALESGSGRSEVFKKCDEIRVHVNAANAEMTKLRAEHNAAVTAWNQWCIEAKAKFNAKMNAEREARQREYLERKNAHKNAEKLVRARRRQNPHVLESSACDTLAQYLVDKRRLTTVEGEERQRRQAAASFDPSKAAPEGCVVMNESNWAGAKPVGKAARKQQQQQQSKKADVQPKEAAGGKPRTLQHPEDKMRLFQLVEQEPPLSIDAIDTCIASLKAKKKEYDSHNMTGDPQLSSSDSEADEKEKEKEEAGEKQREGLGESETGAAPETAVSPAVESSADAPAE